MRTVFKKMKCCWRQNRQTLQRLGAESFGTWSGINFASFDHLKARGLLNPLERSWERVKVSCSTKMPFSWCQLALQTRLTGESKNDTSFLTPKSIDWTTMTLSPTRDHGFCWMPSLLYSVPKISKVPAATLHFRTFLVFTPRDPNFGSWNNELGLRVWLRKIVVSSSWTQRFRTFKRLHMNIFWIEEGEHVEKERRVGLASKIPELSIHTNSTQLPTYLLQSALKSDGQLATANPNKVQLLRKGQWLSISEEENMLNPNSYAIITGKNHWGI